MAGTDTDEFLTAEPAVVVEDEELDEIFEDEEAFNASAKSLSHRDGAPPPTAPTDEILLTSPAKKQQHGVTLRRAVNKIGAMRRRASTVATHVDPEHLNSLLSDQQTRMSPFERSMSSKNVMDTAPTTRRCTVATGAGSWRSKSSSRLMSDADPRQSWRSTPLSGRDKSGVIRSSTNMSELGILDNVSESLQEMSSEDPSTSYTNTSSSLKDWEKTWQKKK